MSKLQFDEADGIYVLRRLGYEQIGANIKQAYAKTFERIGVEVVWFVEPRSGYCVWDCFAGPAGMKSWRDEQQITVRRVHFSQIEYTQKQVLNILRRLNKATKK